MSSATGGRASDKSDGVLLGQLVAFVEISRLCNFTRAAESLGLTQPALSSRLKRLEHEMGAPLLMRDNRGARLTDAGQAFLPYAVTAVEAFKDAQDAVADVESHCVEEITIAASPACSTYLLPPVIAAFSRSRPDVRVRVHSTPSEHVLDMVAAGEADLGMARSMDHAGVIFDDLLQEDMVLVRTGKTTQDMNDVMTARELRRHTVITMLQNPQYRFALRELLHDHPPTRTIDIDNTESAKTMVLNSTAISLLPRCAVEKELAEGVLREISLSDCAPLRRTLSLVRPVSGRPDPAVDSFIDVLEAELVVERA